MRGASYPVILPKSLADALNELSRREGTTLFMTVLAAFKALLYRYTGQEDISIGVPIAGRSQVETEQLIGFFVNSLVMRTDLSGDPSFRELLGRVREVAVGVYAHQELPFERIVEELQPERNAGSQPFFNVMFVHQNMPESSHPLPGLTISQVEMSDQTPVRSDIDFYLWEGESLDGSFVYSTDLFDESTIALMTSRLVELLEEITRAPEVLLTDLLASAKPGPLAMSLRAAADEKVLFSYHQQRMWFIDQFENGNVYESAPTYHNIPLILHLKGDVDTDVLESSLNEIVQRHAILRTRFIADEGRGCQVITPSERLELKVVQCTQSNGLELALTEAREPFALDEDLPIRATIFRLPATEVLLLLTVHHIVADRPSLRLITEELAEIYNARIEGRAVDFATDAPRAITFLKAALRTP
jgi:syringomycin synthetase protein SyrE